MAVVPDCDRRVPATRLLRGAKHESTGELFGARVDYVWLREGAFDATVGYSFFGTYNNDLPSFNMTDHLATLGGSYRTALHTMLLQLTAVRVRHPLPRRRRVRAAPQRDAGRRARGERPASRAGVRPVPGQDFNEEPPRPAQRDIRDANNYMGGFLHLLRFAHDRHFIKAGYQLDYEATEGANFEYLGHDRAKLQATA